MLDTKSLLKEVDQKMQKSQEKTLHNFSTLHTGKASPSMVESVTVEVYGSNMRLKDIASITTPDARTLSVQPWDKSNLKSIEKAIQVANLGLNPSVFGEVVRCPIPELSRERRQELVKMANSMAEEGRISVRSARREVLDALKKAQKAGAISEDDLKHLEKEVQKMTDKHIASIAKHFTEKEKELLQV